MWRYDGRRLGADPIKRRVWYAVVVGCLGARLFWGAVFCITLCNLDLSVAQAPSLISCGKFKRPIRNGK